MERQGPAHAREVTRKGGGAAPESMTSKIIGIFGEILITLGIIFGLFVVWQLWWTDVEAARVQNQILQTFDADLAPAPENEAKQVREDPPAPPADQLKDADTIAVLHIPRFGKDWRAAVLEGVAQYGVLDTGSLGHYPQSQQPGEVGNFAMAGHRQSHGRPLWDVDKLKINDAIVVETRDAYITYRVTESFITDPSDIKVVAPSPGHPGETPTERYLTLTTCHPLYTTKERWIIHAKFESWNAREDGLPPALVEKDGN